MTSAPRIAILVPTAGYEERWQPAFARKEAALVAAGAQVEPRVWTAPGDLSDVDLLLSLFAWGYQRRIDDWRALLDRLDTDAVRVANPVELLRWNSDKAYLADLDAAGVAVVPTQDIAALDDARLAAAFDHFGAEQLVVKPPVSAGADGTICLRAGDPLPAAAQGRRMLVQPMMPGISEVGEFSYFWFAGQFSHAIVKQPAAGDFRVQSQFGGREMACDPDAEAMALSRAAITACPCPPVYARIDMVGDVAGKLHIMEAELIEPSLFLNFAPDGGAAFARAVLAAAG